MKYLIFPLTALVLGVGVNLYIWKNSNVPVVDIPLHPIFMNACVGSAMTYNRNNGYSYESNWRWAVGHCNRAYELREQTIANGWRNL